MFKVSILQASGKSLKVVATSAPAFSVAELASFVIANMVVAGTAQYLSNAGGTKPFTVMAQEAVSAALVSL